MSHDSETSHLRRAFGTKRLWLTVRPFVLASAVVAVAGMTAPVLQRLPHANLSLLFMTGVLIVAVRYGLWPSIYASLLSFLVFNFFFTEPLYTLKVSEEGDLATLVFFLLMASISGNLAFRMRDAMKKRETAIARTVVLQAMTQKVAGAATRDQILQILVDQLADNLTCSVVAIAAEDSAGTAAKHFTSGRIVSSPPGWNDLLPSSTKLAGWTTLPINTKRGRIGAVAINRNIVTREERDYAIALTDQAAIAVERTMLVGDLEEARLVSQREQLRVALLSSVSHDLRTPLSSVIGAASSLLAYESSLSGKDRSELLQSVVEEAERLDRYIQNLLDMTRLGQGELELQRDWEDVRDLVSAASRRLHLNARPVRINVDVSSDAQLLDFHVRQPQIDYHKLRLMREWSEIPILVLSVRGDEKEKVRALDSGANDYVTKPAAISELMARVRVLLRKREPDEAERAIYERNGLRIDLSRREVHRDGVAIHVTRKEYQLLRLLVRSAGRVLTHQYVLREVWGPDFTSETHYLRVLVSGLRQKLGDDPADPQYIVTEQGVGYRLLD